MKIELEDKLAEKFPFMADVYCECGDGWYEIIYGLCTDIVNAYEEKGLQIDIDVGQIKEKFASLRFYFNCCSEIIKDINNLVDKWSLLSEQTCEECGRPGKMRTDRSWHQTLCEECL